MSKLVSDVFAKGKGTMHHFSIEVIKVAVIFFKYLVKIFLGITFPFLL